MFKKGKYIVGPLKSSIMGTVGAVVFPESCDHKQMAEALCINKEVHSAGFVMVSGAGTSVEVELYGHSQSLKVEANQDHTDLVANAIGVNNPDYIEREQPRSEPSEEERILRELIANRVAGHKLYRDDGELQDNSEVPYIDFKRDSARQIDEKLSKRSLHRFMNTLPKTKGDPDA